MMRIGINALCSENRSGTGRYTAQLLLALARVDARNEYHICLPDGSPLLEMLARFPNFHLTAVKTTPVLRRLWFEQFHLLKWIRRNRLDIFHGPAFMLPPRCDAAGVLTIHDLVFRLFPETIPLRRRIYYRRKIAASISRADLILADSGSTARDLQRCLHVSPDRVETIPLGVEERFFEQPDRQTMESVRKNHNLPERYLLTLGTLEPRKNLINLLQSYALLLKTHPLAPDLVIVGRLGWGTHPLRRWLRRNPAAAEKIRLPGYIRDEDLPALYAGAEAFFCISRYEGFGLPPLEAMAAGAPVIVSNVSSLPEVVGDKGLLVDPNSPSQIAHAVALLLAEPAEVRNERIHRARARARMFSWDQTARKTCQAYQKAARIRQN